MASKMGQFLPVLISPRRAGGMAVSLAGMDLDAQLAASDGRLVGNF